MPSFTVTFTDHTTETVDADRIDHTGNDGDFLSFFRNDEFGAVFMAPVLEVQSVRRHNQDETTTRA